MTVETDSILRQARLFHSIEEFIKDTNNDSFEYGFNIPIEYDVMLAIYHEVNNDLRSKITLSLRSHMIYDRDIHDKKKKTSKN